MPSFLAAPRARPAPTSTRCCSSSASGSAVPRTLTRWCTRRWSARLRAPRSGAAPPDRSSRSGWSRWRWRWVWRWPTDRRRSRCRRCSLSMATRRNGCSRTRGSTSRAPGEVVRTAGTGGRLGPAERWPGAQGCHGHGADLGPVRQPLRRGQDRGAGSAAWQFVRFALGGPAPQFADTVRLLVSGSVPRAFIGADVSDRQRWGEAFDLIADAAHQTRPTGSGMSLLRADLDDPARGLVRRTPPRRDRRAPRTPVPDPDRSARRHRRLRAHRRHLPVGLGSSTR